MELCIPSLVFSLARLLSDNMLIRICPCCFAGTLPATLSDQFIASGISNLSYLVLTNNSISGFIPPLWGDAIHGWKDGLSALYLDQNRLTGVLPQLWSDSKSLINLTIMYAYDNMLSGPVGWDAANLPSLLNLVLLPGEFNKKMASACICALLWVFCSEMISKPYEFASPCGCAQLAYSELAVIDRQTLS